MVQFFYKILFFNENEVQLFLKQNFLVIYGKLTFSQIIVPKEITIHLFPRYILFFSLKKSYTHTQVKIFENKLKETFCGIKITLTLAGLSFTVQKCGNQLQDLQFHFGLNHPVFFYKKKNIFFDLPVSRKIQLYGLDLIKTCQLATELRKACVLSVYKDKGIRYNTEFFIKKKIKRI